MSGYTHRDRRAHRDVGRAFWAIVGVSAGLTVLAMAIPLTVVGVVAVVALGALGAVYLGWSDRLLGSYANDLVQAQEGTATDGFVRAEVGSVVGLDRDEHAPRSPSPHVRRPSRSARSVEREAPLPGGSDSDQV